MALFFQSRKKKQAKTSKKTKRTTQVESNSKPAFYHGDFILSNNQMISANDDFCFSNNNHADSTLPCLPSRCCSVRELLIEQGLSTYLASSSGGGLNDTSIKTLLIRVADFLTWTYAKIYNVPLLPVCAMKWMRTVIVLHFKLIGPYVGHLENDKCRSPGTILHTLNDIKKAVIWFLAFRSPIGICESESDELAIQRSDVDPLFHIIRTISRNMTKRMKRDRSSYQKNTLAGIVYQRELPITGLKGLLENVHSQMEWINKFMEKIRSEEECMMVLDKEIYDLFMQTLYAAIYVCAPQGRVGGIAELSCMQGLEMLKCGFTHSDSFKTNSTYGYQPVIVADISCSLLHDYIYYLRPKIIGASTDSTPKAPLWIQFNGSKCSNTLISHKVTRL